MNRSNVFNQSYMPMRYPRNWRRNARVFFRQFKWAYQRATRGFSDYDTWSMDSWLLDILYNSLKYYAEHSYGYPVNFESPEAWKECVEEVAQKLYQANEENHYYPEPMYQKWCEWLEEHEHDFLGSGNPYSKDMFKEEQANNEKRMADFQEGWDKLGKIFFSLFD